MSKEPSHHWACRCSVCTGDSLSPFKPRVEWGTAAAERPLTQEEVDRLAGTPTVQGIAAGLAAPVAEKKKTHVRLPRA